jgi:hypothetical protein
MMAYPNGRGGAEACLAPALHQLAIPHPHLDVSGLEEDPTPMVILAICSTCRQELLKTEHVPDEGISRQDWHEREAQVAEMSATSGMVAFLQHAKEKHPACVELYEMNPEDAAAIAYQPGLGPERNN